MIAVSGTITPHSGAAAVRTQSPAAHSQSLSNWNYDVFTHDPWKHYMLHPDHRAVGFAVIEGIVSARDHLFMPGLGQIGITVWRPEALFLWGAEQADHFEDVSGFVDQKIAALKEHHTQLDEHSEWQERVRQRMAELGQEHGFAAAEPFKKIVV